MAIVHQSPLFLPTSPPVSALLLPAPPKRLALPAPNVAGYLPAPVSVVSAVVPAKKVVSATVANPLRLMDDPKARWEELQRLYGPDRTREEMDAELDAIIPGYTAYMREKVRRLKALEAAS